MNAVQQFVEIVRETPEEESTPAQENTFLKFCTFCFELMPHYRRDDYSECSVCGLKTFKRMTENGMTCLEFAFWLGVVAVILLVVMKDVPW